MTIELSPGGHRFGWIRQEPDIRDHPLEMLTLAVNPAKSDLSGPMPPCWDQGRLGCCSGFDIAGVYVQALIREGLQPYDPAFMAVYYWERMVDHSPLDQDTGSTIRTSAKVAHKFGMPHGELWPYDPDRFAIRPDGRTITDAEAHRATRYTSIPQNLDALRTVLSNGKAVAFGFQVYEAFEGDAVARHGIVQMPRPNERDLGGHATGIFGHDDETKRFKVRNSWGPTWGNGGYFTIPYDYVLDPRLAGDFWTLDVVQ